MKLELGYIQINDIQFSKECKVENSTLFVDPDAVKAFMYEDDDVKAWVKDFSFDVAKPGESVRITPVKDVIEPRVKVEGPGGVFPGVISKVDTVGSGKTYARTFEPAMSHAEYLAAVVAEQLPAKQLPELLAALMQKMETTPAIQKEMRAALRENTQ